MELCDAVRDGGVNLFCGAVHAASNAGWLWCDGIKERSRRGRQCGNRDWHHRRNGCGRCSRLEKCITSLLRMLETLVLMQVAASMWRLRPGGGLSPATDDAIDGMMLRGT
ncbi:unnamed protein product [Ectocarpus sp. CCAP 1310/34]|nr:unnamed protein product [Ectocarpus sp. CCAP 1310/34]